MTTILKGADLQIQSIVVVCAHYDKDNRRAKDEEEIKLRPFQFS